MAGEVAVSIDRHFARIGGKSFAIAQINTVEVTAKHAYRRTAFFWWGIAAAFCLLMLSNPDPSPSAHQLRMIFLFLAAWCGFMCWRVWRRSKILDYLLLFVTSSGSVQAVKSRDAAFIFGLRGKVEEAIAGQLD